MDGFIGKTVRKCVAIFLVAMIMLSTMPIYAAEPSTWTAVDGLGRVIPTYTQVGAQRTDKYVGMFYWTWHSQFAHREPCNVSMLLEEYPDAKNDFQHTAWAQTPNARYFWNEPLYGYYNSNDMYVIRKHAELLADAGVDVLFFDCTNGTEIFLKETTLLMEVFAEAVKEGVNVPKVAFMLNIDHDVMMENNKAELRQLYRNIYKKNKYESLWFYWEGKPLILSTDKCLDPTDSLEKEILEFFTFRQSDRSFFSKDTSYYEKLWGWLSVYPQTKYGVRTDGTVEQMTVSVAQNASKSGWKGWNSSHEYGITAMNDPSGVLGRSETVGPFSYSYNKYGLENITVNKSMENAYYYGLNFQQQWEYALEIDPDMIFITGWNEWGAERFEEWFGVNNAFPDQFNDEYSRDIEPSKGPLQDYYYSQLVANIRRFKGAKPMPVQPDAHTIDITQAASQWDAIEQEYVHYKKSTYARKTQGIGNTFFDSDTMRNDIVRCKVSYDDENVYFMVETVDNISPSTDAAWMRLWIDIGVQANHWEGFEFVVNRKSPDENMACIECSQGGWTWQEVGRIPYSVQGNTLQLSVPREMLGMENSVEFNFKWSDNMQVEGDILDFYQYGDVAPGGRFMFAFSSEEHNDETGSPPVGGDSFPWYFIVTLGCVAGALVTVGLVYVCCFRKKVIRKHEK